MRGISKNIIPVSAIAIAMAVFALCWYAYAPASNENYQKKSIRYGFEIRNTTDQVLKDVDINIFVPSSEDGGQKLLSIDSTMGSSVKTVDGLFFLALKIDTLAPYQKQYLSIDAVVGKLSGNANTVMPNWLATIFSSQSDISEDKSVESISDEDMRLIPDYMLRNKDEGIADYVDRLVVWAGSVIVDQQYSKYARTIKEIFADGAGDCTEKSLLIAAALKRSGIPVRLRSGFVVDGEARSVDFKNYHDWLEYFHNREWVVVDADSPDFISSENYIGFSRPSDGGIFNVDNQGVELVF